MDKTDMLAADVAEYAAKVGPQLAVCFQESMVLYRGRPNERSVKLNEAGGLALIRLLEKHGFEIVKKEHHP